MAVVDVTPVKFERFDNEQIVKAAKAAYETIAGYARVMLAHRSELDWLPWERATIDTRSECITETKQIAHGMTPRMIHEQRCHTDKSYSFAQIEYDDLPGLLRTMHVLFATAVAGSLGL